MPRRGVLPLVLGACLLAVPAPAAGQNRIFRDYREHGTINPCNYSPSELKKGLAELPPDVEAYVPGLGDALRRGCGAAGGSAPTQAQRAAFGPASGSGGGAGKGGSGATAAGSSSAQGAAVPRPPAPKIGAQQVLAGASPRVPGGPLPDIPAWLAAVLAAVAAGGAAAIVAVRYGVLDASGIARSLRAALARR